MSKADEFVKRFEDRACFMCGAKRWRKHKKNLVCQGCSSEFVVLGDDLVLHSKVTHKNVYGSFRAQGRAAAKG